MTSSRSALEVLPESGTATGRSRSPAGAGAAASAPPRIRSARVAGRIATEKGAVASRRGRRGDRDPSHDAVEDALKVMTPRQLRIGIMQGLFTEEQVSMHPTLRSRGS